METQDIPNLYRGMVTPIAENGQHAFIREDRHPRDSGKNAPFNLCFNLMIEHQFGVPLIRQRSLFVCGDSGAIVRYAAQRTTEFIGVVKPLGAYRFLYSPRVRDSYDSRSETRAIAVRYKACFRGHQVDRCKPLLQNISTTLADLEAFFAANLDIDKGIFTFGGLTLKQRIYQVLATNLRYTTENLVEGARGGSEIMLFDCPDGYIMQRIAEGNLPPDPGPEMVGRWDF